MADSSSVPDDILKSAQILWDYMRLEQPLRKSDLVIAMGSHDLRVAEHAARLFLDGWAPTLICSGGLGRLTEGAWQVSEASRFSRIAMEMGVPEENIILEDRSSNTAENLIFTRALCNRKGIKARSAILVHKPYMLRRVWATRGVYWPELEAVLSAPAISFDAYPTEEIPLPQVIHILVGDMQRIILYPKKGYAIPQDVPDDAVRAYETLRDAGYTEQLAEE